MAVTGARPRWFLAVVLVPPETTESALRELFGDLCQSLASVGACLVGGHTEVSSAVTQPVVVGHMLGLAEDGASVASGGAGIGDVVLQVGHSPVEGTAIFARYAADRLGKLDPDALEAARAANGQGSLSWSLPC